MTRKSAAREEKDRMAKIAAGHTPPAPIHHFDRKKAQQNHQAKQIIKQAERSQAEEAVARLNLWDDLENTYQACRMTIDAYTNIGELVGQKHLYAYMTNEQAKTLLRVTKAFQNDILKYVNDLEVIHSTHVGRAGKLEDLSESPIALNALTQYEAFNEQAQVNLSQPYFQIHEIFQEAYAAFKKANPDAEEPAPTPTAPVPAVADIQTEEEKRFADISQVHDVSFQESAP